MFASGKMASFGSGYVERAHFIRPTIGRRRIASSQCNNNLKEAQPKMTFNLFNGTPVANISSAALAVEHTFAMCVCVPTIIPALHYSLPVVSLAVVRSLIFAVTNGIAIQKCIYHGRSMALCLPCHVCVLLVAWTL